MLPVKVYPTMMYMAVQSAAAQATTWWDALKSSAPAWIFAIGVFLRWIIIPGVVNYIRKDLSGEIKLLQELKDSMLLMKPRLDNLEKIAEDLPGTLRRIEDKVDAQQRGHR